MDGIDFIYITISKSKQTIFWLVIVPFSVLLIMVCVCLYVCVCMHACVCFSRFGMDGYATHVS